MGEARHNTMLLSIFGEQDKKHKMFMLFAQSAGDSVFVVDNLKVSVGIYQMNFTQCFQLEYSKIFGHKEHQC